MTTISEDGSVWAPHDGVTEWADCSMCGAHLDPVNDARAPKHDEGWDGGCYYCGAGPEEVGLLVALPGLEPEAELEES